MIVIKTETGSIITDPKEISVGQDLEFLSCLYDSQREADELQSVANVSKLPIRQST